MSLKSKFGGLVALAALVAILGTFGLGSQTAKADPTGITASAASVSSGGTINVTAVFNCNDIAPRCTTPNANRIDITSASATVGTTASFAVSTGVCTVDSDAGGGLLDEAPGNCVGFGDDDLNLTNGNYTGFAGRVAGFDANLADAAACNAYPDGCLRIMLPTTITCTTTSAITFTATQNGLSQSTAVVCNAAAALATGNTITLRKVDQLGNNVAATFSIQAGGGCTGTVPTATCATWTELGRAVLTGGTGSGSSNQPCIVPQQTSPACLTPFTGTFTSTGAAAAAPGFAAGNSLPNGIIRVVEVIASSTCTLVEVRTGVGGPLVAPFAYGAQANNTGTTTNSFEFVNSCTIAGTPSTAGSALAVVVGGSSFGLSNRASVEIYPQPGSDDDARVDIRVRDSNNIPVVNAHVTVLVDKGAIAIRTNTATVGPTGYDVVEPSSGNFGTIYGGDTCDQLITQSVTSGSFTVPFIGIPGYGSSPAFPQGVDGFTNFDGILSACIYVNPDFAPTITPGDLKITAIIEAPTFSSCASITDPFCANYATNIVLTGTLKVVGPPASITVAASPTTLNCGEKATITITIKDSAGQAVSDHTQVELVTNIGGVIGGTGSTLGYPGIPPTGPQSSGAAETFSGVATAFLLTSSGNTGPYEVVAAAGGSLGSWVDGTFNNVLAQILSGSNVAGNPGYNNLSAFFTNGGYAGGGVPSGAPIASQVTVNCSVPQAAAPVAPAVTAPRTGTGPSILPPNTGDAGLAAGTSSSTSLFTIAGVAVFALAGLATLKFARR